MTGSEQARDLSLSANLQRLELLTRGWGGAPLDPRGTVRLINPDATQTPVFWCFNAQQEFPALGAALGADQPLVGMRSLNQVMIGGPLRHIPDMELADYYAQTLLRHFGPVPCIVGGNCQAASVAYNVARRLAAGGATVERLVTLDAVIRRPYSGAIRLLFGENSPKYNPFLTQSDPETAWHSIYTAHDFGFLPAGHGEYFRPEIVERLAASILAPLGASLRRGAHQSAMDMTWQIGGNSNPAAGGTIELTSPASANLAQVPGLAILALWWSPDKGSWLCDPIEYLAPIEYVPERGLFVCHIKAPDQQGHWTLDPVACSEDCGPLAASVPGRSQLEIQVV